MRAFRLVDQAFAGGAFSGDGARRYGGRWNSPGTAMVYTAQSLSLVQLELLVHLESDQVLRGHWLWFAVEVDDRSVLRLADFAALPPDFAATPPVASTRRLGDDWVQAAASVAVKVPSAVTPGEFNLLLNPNHPEFTAAVTIGEARRLNLDPRLAVAASC